MRERKRKRNIKRKKNSKKTQKKLKKKKLRIGAAARVLATTLAMRSPWKRRTKDQLVVVPSFRRSRAAVAPFSDEGEGKQGRRPKASSDGGGSGVGRKNLSRSLSPLSWKESLFLALSRIL